MLRIQFQVTQQDIDQGRTGAWCPIELALMREGYKVPRVYATSMRIEKEYAEFPLPGQLKKWIHSYDNDDKPVAPFTYTLEVPNYAVSLPTSRNI